MPSRTWQRLHWDAILAHAAVARAVKRGDLVPEPCEVCGERVALAHHDDYEQRLVVRWLCDSHHRYWHLAHPVDHVVPAPPPRVSPVTARPPTRGRMYRRYKQPMAVRLRAHGATYQEIADTLRVSTATAFSWCKSR